MIEIAHANLDRWTPTAGRSAPYLEQWRRILALPLADIEALIVQDSEKMTALRQSSPFAGMLTPSDGESMTRMQLEHIVRTAASIADENDIVVMGSPSVLGQFPDAPAELRISREADVYPMRTPELADLIDGSIGEGSPFEAAFGYYAHGVGEETSVLPEGWKERLILVDNANTRGVRGWCLEVHDLAIAKLVADREKDLDFLRGLVRHGMIGKETLPARLAATALSDPLREIAHSRLIAIFPDNHQ